ncbi:anchor protein [Opitutaceae bacterium TAV5]|nr:anchor protein [Opitutaceae bacterium TAV5]
MKLTHGIPFFRLCVVAGAFVAAAAVQGATLVSYEFGTTNKLNPTFSDPDAITGPVTINSYANATASSYYGLASNSANLFTRLANRAQAAGDPETPFAEGSTLADAISNGGFYSFTIEAEEGRLLDLTSLTVQLGTERLSGASAFTAHAWLCDENGNPLGSTTKNAASATLSWNDFNVDLSTLAPAASFTFRIYVAGEPEGDAEYNQVIRLRNVTLTGSVIAVPEPGAWALIAGALLLSFAFWRARSSRGSH